jgi:hypothetical protein
MVKKDSEIFLIENEPHGKFFVHVYCFDSEDRDSREELPCYITSGDHTVFLSLESCKELIDLLNEHVIKENNQEQEDSRM